MASIDNRIMVWQLYQRTLKVRFLYAFDRLTNVGYNGVNRYTYEYGANGQVAVITDAGVARLLNVQGNVVGLTDASGNLVVEYKYDAWGKLLGISGSLATSLGTANPLRYRGYVYDTETGLYYLHSRYYNPEMRRFVSVDIFLGFQSSILSHNIYSKERTCLKNTQKLF